MKFFLPLGVGLTAFLAFFTFSPLVVGLDGADVLLNKASGVWYNSAYDEFRILDADHFYWFPAIALADPNDLDAQTQLGMAYNVNETLTDVFNRELVLDVISAHSDGNPAATQPFPILLSNDGTHMFDKWSSTEDQYTYLGKATDWKRIASELYRDENRPYSKLEQRLYHTLQSGPFSQQTAAVYNADYGYIITVSDDALNACLSRMETDTATESDWNQWAELVHYYRSLMKEAHQDGYNKNLYLYQATGKQGLEILRIDGTNQLVFDFLGLQTDEGTPL